MKKHVSDYCMYILFEINQHYHTTVMFLSLQVDFQFDFRNKLKLMALREVRKSIFKLLV